MTDYKYNNLLNYNYSNSTRLLLHVEKFTGTRRKNISYAYAQNILSKALIILLLMTVGSIGVWAQDGYSGIWYIANNKDHSSTNFTNNWYLVPAGNPQRPDSRDAYYSPDHNQENGDPAKPFLTTYKTKQDAANPGMTVPANNSVWIIQKDGDDYYFIHAATGKYVIYEIPLPNDPNTNSNSDETKNGKRKTMHLQATTENGYSLSSNANFKFVITSPAAGQYNIRPKSRSGWYWNPAGNNANNYYGTSGGDIYHLGLVGVYNNAADNSRWHFENAQEQMKPSINFDAVSGSYTISASLKTTPNGTNFAIRYTTDGSEPTISSPIYDGSTIIVESPHTVKAIVTGYGMILSGVEERYVSTALPEAPTFEVTCDNKLQINSNISSARLYYTYTTDNSEPSDPTNSSTEWTAPVVMPDNAKIKAIAYNGSHASAVSDTYTFIKRTESPTITLNETTAEIAFETGATLYFTTDGSDPSDPYNASRQTYTGTSPKTITGLSYTKDADIRAVAETEGREPSCPVQVKKRPKKPTFTATSICDGTERRHTLTFTGTQSGKTYWYALSNGSGQTAPDLNTFKEYTPGTPVDITTITNTTWNETDVWVTLHAYAKDADGYTSAVVSQDYLRKYTASPTISHSGTSVTITATTGAIIKYSVDGGSIQTATTTTTFTVLEGRSHIIRAAAQYGEEGESCEEIHTIILPTTITTLEELKTMEPYGAYILGNDITGAGSYTTIGTNDAPFTGSFDGAGYTISGLTQPLFGTTNGATIHDVNLKEVNISSSLDNVGAIVCDAKGYTRIYNCGILPNNATFPSGSGSHPSVSTSGSCAGSIVGKLEGDSRVVNCFSYADVSSSGTAAGIVGNNTYASDASLNNGKYTKLKTMVVNCMFYGNISATTYYPVYGGEMIKNDANNSINNYNYYSVGCQFSGNFGGYNCSWPAQLDYLTRYEFHRNILNSNRELCGWWVGAPDAPSTMKSSDLQAVPKDASLIKKWVLDPSVAPYPILKPFGYYPSPINLDADASWRTTANEWEGKSLGTIRVTINAGTHGSGSTTKDITITDMDTLHADYCYRKIQLPYYNTVFGNPNGATWAAKYGGNYTDYVVTGWDITSVTTDGTITDYHAFVEDWQTGYNFADRHSTAKDQQRVFAQGGYYYVPDGVTGITITAHWGKAVYLGNGENSYDRANFTHNNNKAGTAFAPAGTRSTLGNRQTVYTGKIATVAANLPNSGTVFDNAIVLVGNHQYCTGKEDITPSRSFTIMSADFDLDNEPDYCLHWQLGEGTTRQTICPIRFDFLPVVEIGLGLKKSGSTQYYSLGCYRPLGHFEVTETALIRFGQFEFSNVRSSNSPIILNGGIFEQYTKGTIGGSNASNDKITYIIIGGNVKIPSFTPGSHVNANYTFSTRHCAVNVLGGNINNLYLTGNYNEKVTPYKDNPHCYIDGGRFKHVAAAGKEGINGNVTFQINHSKIWEFYGGSTLADKLVTGSIDVTIDNSIVNKYCGGPKFGDMNAGKTVTTNATGTTFGVYYGGGNGGTCYVQYDNSDGEQTVPSDNNFDWSGTGKLGSFTAGKYRNITTGYMADYDMDIINVSTGTNSNKAVYRTYLYAAQFSATNTGSITNTLTDCTVLTNFYGGGNLGGVNGDIESTLTGTTHVYGSAFGAGYSASIPQVKILQSNTKTAPTIDVYTGIVTPQSGGTYDTYTWSNEGSTSNPITTVGDNKYFYTEIPLQNLGSVSGNVTLNITGSSVVEGNVYNADLSLKEANAGGVFGGGDESKVSGTDKLVTVNINTTSDNHATKYINNVFGGGNNGDVASEVKVNVTGSSYVKHDVYGGGKGQTTVVGGDVTVNIGTATTENETTTYSGDAQIDGNVYGGSAFGNVNVEKVTDDSTNPATTSLQYVADTETKVNLYGGAVTGNVFGGGLGQRGESPIASNVYGPVIVTAEGGSAGNVFGCNDQNGAPQSTVNVLIHGTSVPESPATYAIGNVYGGGNLAAYTGSPIVTMSGGAVNKVYGGGLGESAVITGNTSVTLSGGTVSEDVYGGGDAANVTGTVDVNITGGTVTHDVYGGGALANTNTVQINTGTEEEPVMTYPNTTVNLTGGTIRNVYGGGLGRKEGTPVEAKSGNVLLKLNEGVENTAKGCVVSEIFGCNNLNGTPLGTVTVKVFKTQNAAAEHIAGQTGDKAHERYDVTAVYGGGNLAAYNPTDAANGRTVVEIYGCDETSIEYVYGGGNAAPVPATDVTIDSSFEIFNVFGGGNGSDPNKPGADVGIIDPVAYATNKTTGIYGTGEAVTKLVGGNINTVYGGSNTKGNVRGGSSVSMPRKNEDCPLDVQAIYGAGQNAEQSGVSKVIVGCASNLENVYGGSKNANVGGVDLIITGGTYQKVFGGNDTNGIIHGPITVTLEETDNCPLIIDELYLGGNLAPYSVYGYYQDGTDSESHPIYKGRSSLTDNTGTPVGSPEESYSDTQWYADPKLNIVSCTRIGKVFGGGLGTPAILYGNPTVNLNMIPGRFATQIDRETPEGADGNAHALGTIGDIYGGGSLANVNGNATVNISTETDVLMKSARDNENNILPLQPNKFVEGAYIVGDIYGGGLSADVIGDTQVNIGMVNYEGTDIADYNGVQITGNVFGGGKGATTKVTGSVAVTIGEKISDTGYTGPTITGDIYGGSALGSVNSSNNTAPTENATTSVTLNKGTVTGSVFGGGLGDLLSFGVDHADVAAQNFGNTIVTMENGTVNTAVYGGANINGVLKQKATVTLIGGTVGTDPGEGAIQDVVFGGGKGQPTLVEGDVEVNIGTMTTEETPAPTGAAIIWGHVYGGSALGNVNAYNNNGTLTASTYTDSQSNTAYRGTNVNFYGGAIHGDIYGGALGQREDIAANVYGPVAVTTKGTGTATNVFGCNNHYGAPQRTVNVTIDGGTFSGNIYGGGNEAAYTGSPVVTMSGGTAVNVFGGGLGSTADITGNTSVTISGTGEVTTNVYGGGSEADLIGNAEVTVSGGSANTVYGGGNLANVSGTTTVNVTGGTLSGTAFDDVTAAVFGGGYGNTTTVGGTVTVNIGARTLKENSTTEYDYSGSATITGDVYGGSAKGKVNTTDGSNRTTDAVTNVNLYGGDITGDIYGGGLGDNTYEANVYGPVTVTTAGGGSATNVFGCNNIKGAPQNTVAVNIGGSTITNNVYGGGNQAAYTYTDENNPLTVTMTGGTVGNDLFGGGLSADVSGSVSVTISGGYVTYDVYGGGALAHTNTANWNPNSGSRDYYLQVYGLTAGGTNPSSVTNYYTKSPDIYEEASGTAVSGVTYYQQSGGSYTAVPDGLITPGSTDVSHYYTTEDGDTYTPASGTAVSGVTYYQQSGGNYTPVTTTITPGTTDVSSYYTKTLGTYSAASGTAVEGTKYYQKKTLTGTWANTALNNDNTTKYNTTVSLIGGKVGNVYGGGLGEITGINGATSTTEAFVYGDVTVTVGDKTDASVGATAFTREIDNPATTATGSPVYKTGHLFAANNINGTPTGDITVNVYKTAREDGGAHQSGKTNSANYEIQGVYGGGNQADYLPMSGKKSKVYVDGCSNVSIEFVYGGGNSASVPGTNVDIQGAWEIGYAFGGGNGNDKILKPDGTTWYFKGADVNGDTHIDLHGGTIHWAFGGSNRLGDCTGDIYYRTLADNNDCPLKITTLYGAGQNADVDGNLDLVIKCPGSAIGSYIENVYGGSLNAKISGGVTMTIIGGIYQNVHGGNDQSGSIGGPITINIQETSDCQPVIIENLYGGGNKAPYPASEDTRGKIEINVKSCTRIGTIYTGGHEADVNGDTELNINMVKGYWAENKNTTTVQIPKIYKTIPNITDVADIPNDENNITCKIKNEIGTIGDVFGGGDRGLINGNSVVNIGTLSTVSINHYNASNNIESTTTPAVLGAHITGNIYGGGNLADVTGKTYVNICAKEVTVDESKVWQSVTEGASGVTIGGDVFGGGNGIADNFYCDKAMVGVNNENDGQHNAEHINDGTHVNIGHGTVNGSVYGGGRIGRVEYNSAVTIGYGDGVGGAKSPVIEGDVFAAGKGVNTHGYSALVRGNSTLTVQGDTWVKKSVYGGGELASVGKYEVGEDGMPHALVSQNLGTCTVAIRGNAEIGPNGMTMPTFSGHVFGGGKGVLPYEGYADTEEPYQVLPTTTVKFPSKKAIGDGEDAAYMKFIETLALATKTDVTISGNAFIKGSVYGGSENGYVQKDTHVMIAGGQIGCGKNTTSRHPDDVWATDYTPTDANNLECAHWEYASPYATYDMYAKYESNGKYYYDSSHTKYAEGGRETGTDGHTYYGNVFGGGSGVKPYSPGKWHRQAGSVGGNATVDITGGHILTSLYGGNEQTDVGTYTKDSNGALLVPASGGKCTINMVGGTLGVPRTLTQIAAHPVTCYLFGAGKGDQRIFFNTWTNVINSEVNITGNARIYGSTFGGGEDGHVIENADTYIGGSVSIDLNGDGDTTDEGETFTAKSNLKIGTWGTSYVDGNVFGGGRGFSGDAITAGSIGGDVTVNITGGTMLGSIYGGGRLASVGTYFTDPNSPLYGQLQEDGGNKKHGHIKVNIHNATIGKSGATGDGAKYCGNVFGGCMGRLTLLDGSTNPIWPELAQAKTVEVNITGNDTHIYRNVYGGGEFGSVRENVYVTIGGTLVSGTTPTSNSTKPTIDGCVYGGGYGSDNIEPTKVTVHWKAEGMSEWQDLDYVYTPMQWAGMVGGNTTVSVFGGAVKQNVYGGGQLASVGIIDYQVNKDNSGTPSGVAGYYYPNITKHADIENEGETTEKVYGFGLSWPYKFKYVAYDPADATKIGGKTTVNITGGHIGSTTWDDRTGYVFGGSKGQVAFKKKVKNDQDVLVEVDITDVHEQRYTEAFCANVRETAVNINYGSTPTDKTPSNIGAEDNCIMGAVYGGGEDGHVYENTAITFTNGLTGLSIYGGGKGEGTYKGKLRGRTSPYNWVNTLKDLPSWTAGKVYGNTSITMTGGHVMGNVYGGGNLGSVGKGNYSGGTDDYYPAGYGETLKNAPLWTATDGFNPDAEITTLNKPTTMADYFLSSGKCTITIEAGIIGTENGTYGTVGGTDNATPTGMVFGGSRGRAAEDVGALSPRYDFAPDFFLGYANNTKVTIGKENAASGPTIYSQVFGGGRDGHIRNSAHVIIYNGTIGQPYANSTDDYQRKHRGNVYGSGSGLGTWDSGTHHGTSSGSVTRHTQVDIYDGTIYQNVYGGGAMASVGPPRIPPTAAFAEKNWSSCQVNIYGGEIGKTDVYEAHEYGGCVYGASRGGDVASDESADDYATVIWTEVNVKNTYDNTGALVSSPSIAGDVYGGGQAGDVKKDTEVQLTGGTIKHDAYGGGKGTKTDVGGIAADVGGIAADVGGNTTVELNKGVSETAKGCIVNRIFGCNNLNGTPKGHVLVHVYATQNSDTDKKTILDKFAKDDLVLTDIPDIEGLKSILNDKIKIAKALGIDVTDYNAIYNGSATANEVRTAITTLSETITTTANTDEKKAIIYATRYDVQAVYGGGNLAFYQPKGPNATATDDDYKNTKDSTEVIIDGCELTSIYQVYGGSNAASVPAASVNVYGSYEIEEVFGGGNGKDSYPLNGKIYENPGANVGYKNYAHFELKSGTTNEYEAVDNTDAITKDLRETNYGYGTGKATTHIAGGRIHAAYGGSNTKGNIRTTTMSVYESMDNDCPLKVNETYGAGKDAMQDGSIDLTMDCVRDMEEIFGGAKNADVNADVVLNITNGSHFKKVFGGNNTSGAIAGSITVNIMENGCEPIKIEELYAGGYLAPYSVYGYDQSPGDGSYTTERINYGGSIGEIEQRVPRTKKMYEELRPTLISKKKDDLTRLGFATDYEPTQAEIDAKVAANPSLLQYAVELAYMNDLLTNYPKKDPRINVISATRIDNIYGGGYNAKVVGNPHVNVNMTTGRMEIMNKGDEGHPDYEDVNGNKYNDAQSTSSLTIETQNGKTKYYVPLPLGNIGNIFGGGNMADISGDTYVDIGTGEWLNDDMQREMLGTTTSITSPTTFTYKKPSSTATSEVWTYETTETIGGTPTPVDGSKIVGTYSDANITIDTPTTFTYNSTTAKWTYGTDGTLPAGANPTPNGVCQIQGTYSTITTTFTYKEVGDSWTWTYEKTNTIEEDPTPARNEADITGTVYGGCNEADVTGNTNVRMDNGYVFNGIFGGGFAGSVGTFTRSTSADDIGDYYDHTSHEGCIGKPISCEEGTGKCTIVVTGGQIGPVEVATKGMTRPTAEGGPVSEGWIWGGSRGLIEDPLDEPDTHFKSYVGSTDVTIGGTAFVLESIIGGGEFGRVLGNTLVKIQDHCQIGVGAGQTEEVDGVLKPKRYTDGYDYGNGATPNQFINPLTTPVTDENKLAECSHYPYGRNKGTVDAPNWVYEPYDPYYDDTKYATYVAANPGLSPASTHTPSDGKTWIGCVFGGGSGYMPFANESKYDWIRSAGLVEGNSEVQISGGHILTNVYGGNEITDVKGKSTVKMTGGTLGVPRTLEQIAAHPVTCYLFGAGKGDQRAHFDKFTNVGSVEVEVSGGIIYGSVFGGAEDGHVLGDAKVKVTEGEAFTVGEGANAKTYHYPIIGTWGTSYVDGNIFGGGRGFSGENVYSGNISGSIDLDITGGTMLGSIYGGGRLGSVGYGLYATNNDNYGTMRPDGYADDGTTAVSNFKRGYVDINISGGTIGNDYEYKNYTFDIDRNGKTEAAINTEKAAALTALKVADNIPNTEFEQVDSAKVGETTTYTYTYRLKHTKGGNVFTGSMGRRTRLDGTPIDKWWRLGNTKSTKLTISGDAWIKSNVYGGGEFGAIVPYEDKSDEDNPVVEGGTTTIDIQGGTIGTEVKDGEGTVKYTYGSVFGGGYGTEDEIEDVNTSEDAYRLGALVKGNSTVGMSGGHVWASVFGGGELAAIGGNTNVTISGGEIGKDEVKPKTDSDPGYVMFGGATMGNVYGGGKGNNTNTLLGVVQGNTNVTVEDAIADATYAAAHNGVSAGDVISSPKIYHNVYGGGALGSVGTFVFSDGVTSTGDYYYMQTVPKGIPLIWTANTGKATVNIKGGTIGISGRDNGMVDGSSRGGIAKPIPTVLGVSPTGTALKDPYDKMAWVESSEVNIGTENATTGPHIKGSVYGGGENGHVFTHATVNMMSGTIGIVDDTDPWYDFGNTEITQKARGTRGNIYGAGCGTDMYDSDDDGIDDTHNSWAGCVIGNTEVNISGGVVAQNVYGGGSMGSVGRLMEGKNDIVKHEDATDGFALSWPVKFTYQNLSNNTSTGKATINITGGRIGTTGSGNGDVFGGTRGEAGDRYAMAQLANVRETEVNINYGSTPTNDNLAISVPAIAGSVYGGSENGHVYEDTHVTLTNGLIGHSVYGGGKGEGQYMGKLIKVGTGPGATPPRATEYTDPMLIYDWLAGKVYGNTHLTIVNGRVLNNVMGGGYMASVGKGNYSGGADDFYTPGYGETIKGNLWTSSFKPELAESETNKKDWAWYFLNSGMCYVNVFGGNIGSTSVMEGLPAGNIFGGSHGMPAPSLRESSRHLYNPEWFNGYANETYVTIGGGYRCIQACEDKNDKVHAVGEMLSLHELQELFKGKTDIVAANGTPNESYWTLDNVSVPKIWGSVYGGSQDGRIRRDAHVIVNAGDIGLPYTDANRTLLDMENKATSITSLTNEQLSAELDDPQWLHRGNVYGAGSGLSKYKFDFDYDGDYDNVDKNNGGPTKYYSVPTKEEDYCQFAGSVIRYTQVDILGGTIHRNVYGGGSVGSVGPPAVPPTRTETAYKPGTTTRDANYGTETIGEGWWSQSRVNIKGIIGTPDGYTTGFKYNPVYGGEVFGACRGDDEIIKTEQDKINFATTVWTMVHIMNGANIMGNVFGGGDAGMVKKDSEVLVGD